MMRNGVFQHNSSQSEVIQMQIAKKDDAQSKQDLDELFREIKATKFDREAEVFKALGHPIRLKIVYGLVKVGGCNVKNMQECLGLHQATVSQHLIHLKSRGIITSTRHGLEMVYTVEDSWAQCVIDNIEKKKQEAEKAE
jgi:DNA-binding transcriptional ArsR family regulator